MHPTCISAAFTIKGNGGRVLLDVMPLTFSEGEEDLLRSGHHNFHNKL
jgi:hypothetical protein